MAHLGKFRKGWENEHLATRGRAGLYDVYYQVLVDIKGKDSEKLLQRVLVNDVARMTDGKVLYSSLCSDSGGMIDDLTCFRLSPNHFWLCPTPSRVDRVVAYLSDSLALERTAAASARSASVLPGGSNSGEVFALQRRSGQRRPATRRHRLH